MSDELHCVAGCKAFHGGELKHHPDCPFYPESLTKLWDDERAELDARIRLLEQQLSTAREALEPFASAFQQARLSYAKRYHNVPLDHGFSIFDKMPDKWPMELESFSMGDFRRAAAAIRSLGEKDGHK